MQHADIDSILLSDREGLYIYIAYLTKKFRSRVILFFFQVGYFSTIFSHVHCSKCSLALERIYTNFILFGLSLIFFNFWSSLASVIFRYVPVFIGMINGLPEKTGKVYFIYAMFYKPITSSKSVTI